MAEPDVLSWPLSRLEERYAAGNMTSRQYHQGLYNLLGPNAYMQSRPELYDPSYKWYQDERYGMPTDIATTWGDSSFLSSQDSSLGQEASDWQALLEQFTGSEATYIRTLIQKRINTLKYWAEQRRASVARYSQSQAIELGRQEQAALETGWQPSSDYLSRAGDNIGQARIDAAEGRNISSPRRPAVEPMPVPGWMQPYLETSIPIEEPTYLDEITKRGFQFRSKGEKASTLRPMSAQAELTSEQMGLMGGYQAWGKAGSPLELGKLSKPHTLETIEAMADWEKWWIPYTIQSALLFPTTGKLRSRWTTAFQR